MTLRPATGGDAAGVAAMEQALFGVDAWSPASVLAELSGGDRFAVVAVSGDVLLGYAMTTRTDDVVDLHRIGVDPRRRRQGVAHALLAAVLGRAAREGAHRVLLEVSASNGPAVAFYVAEGFVQIDRRRRYYRDGSDALVLHGPLHGPLGRAAGLGGGWADD